MQEDTMAKKLSDLMAGLGAAAPTVHDESTAASANAMLEQSAAATAELPIATVSEVVAASARASKDSSPSAQRRKYLFAYFFDIYNEVRMHGTEKVEVEADTEDEALTIAVGYVPTKDGEGFRYTGRFTKTADV